ncbi:MAG: hypothetical protein GF334_09350 [Candidatus Altiarchaeales archaeon]|nr:hypothetical protein [Candidatus Altiarchaeales archaeon]
MSHLTIPRIRGFMDSSLGEFNLVFRGDKVVDVRSKHKITPQGLSEIYSGTRLP